MAVRQQAIDSVTGPTRDHVIEHENGRRSHVTYCGNCLTFMWGYSEELPQIRGLNAGSLDASAGLQPYGNMWTRSARPWVSFAPGPQFEQHPDDPLALVRAWQDRADAAL